MFFNVNPTLAQNQVFNLQFLIWGVAFVPKGRWVPILCEQTYVPTMWVLQVHTHTHTRPNKQSPFLLGLSLAEIINILALMKRDYLKLSPLSVCLWAVNVPAAYSLPYFLPHTTKHLQPSLKDGPVYRKNTLLDLTNRLSRVFLQLPILEFRSSKWLLIPLKNQWKKVQKQSYVVCYDFFFF